MANYPVEILNKIINILKEDRYKDKSKKSVDFPSYARLKDFERYSKGDEDSLVTPIILEILKAIGYKSGVNIFQQEFKVGDKPDFRTKTNKFILDAKSTGVDISTYRTGGIESATQQIARYLKNLPGYDYGILFNLEKFEFFQRTFDESNSVKARRLEDRTINLVKLYQDYHKGQTEIDKSEDFKNLKWFIENFSFKEISSDEYIEIIKSREKSKLNPPDKEFLQKTVYKLLDSIQDDIAEQVSDYEEDSDDYSKIQIELRKIKSEIKLPDSENQTKILIQEFVKQASYVLLTKLILIRILEDNDLIEKNLYNGGFKKLTEPPFNYTLFKILDQAKLEGKHFYPYFFATTAYDFDPSKNDIFLHALYELSNFNFAEVNFDLIGDLYEHYLNLDDRKEKGQYYTPHYIVEFILNRVGFTGYYKGGIDSRTLWDPASGSGGFIVEAARRLRVAGINNPSDAKKAIVNNIYATELTAFASFLCELNTVIQILPLVKSLTERKNQKIDVLRIFKKDSLLQAFNHEEIGIKETAYPEVHILDSSKEMKFHILQNKNDFDFVVGNPPYVGESGHKELFRPLQDHPYWKKHYLGKSDYLYYFIILGLDKLKDGGKLAFITTQYWLTADGAKNLRKYILETSKIVEIIDFKGIKLFPEAKGQENIVFILERCDEESERINNKIKLIHFKKEWVLDDKEYIASSNASTTNFENWKKLITNPSQFEIFSNPTKSNFNLGKFKRDDIADVYYSAVLQGELDSEAWYIFKKEKDEFSIEDKNVIPLEELFNVKQGVVPGPIKISSSNIKQIPIEHLNLYNIEEGDGVFVLSNLELEKINLNENEKKIIKKFFKNSNINKCYIDYNTELNLIYTPEIEDITNYPNIEIHLKKFKPILEKRREVEKGTILWYELWWGRNKEIFENEKIMISYRTTSNSFAYTNFPFYSATDTYYINQKSETNESLKYVFAILISTKILDWLKNGNCKIKGNALELFTTSVSKIPIRKIDFANPKDVAIHNLLSGDYSLEEKKGYKYNSTSNTWIKEKGIVDYYMDLIKELYDMVSDGFIFDPTQPLKEPKDISIAISKLSGYLKKTDFSSEIIDDLSFFESNTITNPVNADERKETEAIFKSRNYFFKIKNKNFEIKKIGEIIGSGYTLYEHDSELKKFNYKHQLELITKTNEKIYVEIKGKEYLENLIQMIESLFREKKTIIWDDLRSLPVINEKLNKFIEKKKDFIYQSLKPVDKSAKLLMKEIVKDHSVIATQKFENVFFMQELIDTLVEEIY